MNICMFLVIFVWSLENCTMFSDYAITIVSLKHGIVCSIGHRYDMSLPLTSHKTMKLHNINIRRKLSRNVPMCPVC